MGGGRERERERERRRERGSGKAACLGQGDTPCAGCRLQAAAGCMRRGCGTASVCAALETHAEGGPPPPPMPGVHRRHLGASPPPPGGGTYTQTRSHAVPATDASGPRRPRSRRRITSRRTPWVPPGQGGPPAPEAANQPLGCQPPCNRGVASEAANQPPPRPGCTAGAASAAGGQPRHGRPITAHAWRCRDDWSQSSLISV